MPVELSYKEIVMFTSLSHAQTSSKAYFTKGTAELAKNPAARNKDIVQSSFINAINCMSKITDEQWTTDDYIRVMQSYQYAVECSSLTVSETLNKLTYTSIISDTILKSNIDHSHYALDQILSSATKFYFNSSGARLAAADFHLAAALTFLFPLVNSMNNELDTKKRDSLQKAIEFASYGAVNILDQAITSLLKQKTIYNHQLRSLSKCYAFQGEIFLNGKKNLLCFQSTMLGIKAINNISFLDKSAEDISLIKSYFIRLAAVIPDSKSKADRNCYNTLIEIICSMFHGGSNASSKLLTSTLNQLWDRNSSDPGIYDFALQCLRVIEDTHRSTLLPSSELTKTLLDPHQFNLFQEMKNSFELRVSAAATPSNSGMFKRESNHDKINNTEIKKFHYS